MHRQPFKIIAQITIVAFGTIVFFGVLDCTNPFMQSRMNMDFEHHQVECIPGQNCGMNIGEHLNTWQGMTTATIAAGNFTLLVLMAIIVFSTFRRLPLIVFLPNTIRRFLFHARQHRESKLYNYFLLVFSNGILQPKLFV